jgi:hypothetical protein
MKKIMLLSVLVFFGVSVYAQTGKYFSFPFYFSKDQLEQEMSKVRAYDEFDHYYYDYARSFFTRKSAYKHLDFVRDYRRNLWGRAVSGDLQQVYNDFNKEWDKMLKDVPLTYRETFVINEYKNRPETRERMLQKKEWYDQYDTLVFESISEKLTTAQGKMYLQQARDLREAVSNSQTDTASIYASLRYVLDKTNNYKLLDDMSAQERALIEEYLAMPVSVEGKAYTLPLDEYLVQFRNKLPLRQRANYPVVHYEP